MFPEDRPFKNGFDVLPDRPRWIGRIAREHGSDYFIHIDRDTVQLVLKWAVLKNEFNSLIDPIRAQYPDLGTERLISFLSGADQAHAYAIDRELLEMTGLLR